MKLVSAVFVLALALCAGDDQRIRDDFLAWYKTYTGSPMPSEVVKFYSAVLARQGLDQAAIRERISALQKIAATNPAMLTVHFDRIYARGDPIFSHEPNALLVRTAARLTPGKALDVAMGQRRNSVYLAGKGWDVTGYDFSEKGIAAARANAEKAGVKINAVVSTHQDFDLGKERWDLI
jgi:2-polyprenyl-3-methyl-5-hydroxy-6-metoxy-1,4-benzoquinol methylase